MDKPKENNVTKKPLSFKDFMVVDYTPGQPDLVSYQAMKRKRGRIGEELDVAQRRKMSVRMKRLAPRIKIARDKAMRRTANMSTIKKRTERMVRNAYFKKLSRGKSREEVPVSRRKEIEKRLDRFKPIIKRVVKRSLPKTRKIERDRKRGKKS